MGWDGAGGYTRQHNFSADASAGIKILALRMDQELDDIASAIPIALAKNGQNVPTANLPMGGFRHINVGAPTSVNNYFRVREFIENVPIFMDDQESSADRVSVSAQYFTSVSANQAPGDGTRIIVRAKSTKASAVLYLNGHSANVEFQDGNAANGVMVSGGVYEFIYSSVDTAWKIQNPDNGRTTAEIAAGVTPTNYQYEPGNVLRYGTNAVPGTTPMATAVQNAMDSNGRVWVPKGTYLIDADLVPPSGCAIEFEEGAAFLASANNRIIFKTTTTTNYVRIIDAYLDGNGFTGVQGIKFIGLRHKCEIRNARIEDCADGIVLDQLCWDIVIYNPYIINTTRPITIRDGSNAVTVVHPALDTYTTGITIENGPTFDTTSNLIVGGHVQNGTDGIFDDGAFGTVIQGTYFEGNTDADIEFDGSKRATVYSSQHYASTGVSAIKGRSADGVTVFDPTMTNGSRSTGLFDFDGTNANCHAFRVVTAGGINQPEGTTTGIGSIPAESSGTFTPVIVGSSAAGVGTYTTQSGTWRLTGRRVHVQIEVAWSAHTGTGNITITGIPTALTPTSFTPRRIGKVSPVDIAITGPHSYVFLNGTNTVLGLVESSTTGVEANVAMDAAGTLYINLDYDL